MENKYYTPEIEEFHVGFEFYMPVLREDDNGDLYRDKYCKHIWTEKSNMWEQFNLEHKSNGDTVISVPECLTVKYLDREDIESLGFRQHSTDDRIYRNSDGIILNTGWGSPVIKDRFTTVITHQVFDESKLNVVHENFLFNGTIKNKSELKRLLKQLGI